ncbi:unnamed protein product [Caenorhabditis angaria]|uniref:Uncharacterized protein n=1 Tax=Caenorhabditis angaria TaxID=860376 RepID=A0A9P1MVK0_9PELO|nr:unnamed protein product [Caenorhabditis angaria]
MYTGSEFQDEDIGPYEFEGLVITGVQKFDEGITNFVLLMSSPETKDCHKFEIFGVHESAFTFTIKEDIEKYVAFKNVVRRTSEPLRFGAIVKWNTKTCDLEKRIIHKFAREKSIFAVRSSGICNELRIGGVMNPDQSQFWNTFCPVNIPRMEALKAEPNVWLQSWVGIHVNGTNTQNVNINFEFAEFDDFDNTEQHRILSAPWNRANGKRQMLLKPDPTPTDDDDDILLERSISNVRAQNEWREDIYYQRGLFVGNHLIISRDMPQYDFIHPIRHPYNHKFLNGRVPTYPVAGEYLRFCASWSTLHHAFMVLEIDREHEFKNHRQSSSGNLKIGVKVSPEHPYLFIDSTDTLGLIDDPGYHLALWTYYVAYHPNLEAKVEITPVRATHNKSVRYRIVKRISSDATMSCFESWLQTAEFSVENVIGTAISDDTLISPQYPNILFKWVSLGEIKAGMTFRFSAIYRAGHGNEFLIVNPISCPGSASILTCSKVFTHEYALAKSSVIRVKMVKDKRFEQIAHSDVFGPIDTRQKHIDGDEFIAWVTESPKVKGTRQACTILEIFSTEIGIPVGFPEASRNKDNVFYQSGSAGSAASSTVSSSKRNFDGPTIRKLNSRTAANTSASNA